MKEQPQSSVVPSGDATSVLTLEEAMCTIARHVDAAADHILANRRASTLVAFKRPNSPRRRGGDRQPPATSKQTGDPRDILAAIAAVLNRPRANATFRHHVEDSCDYCERLRVIPFHCAICDHTGRPRVDGCQCDTGRPCVMHLEDMTGLLNGVPWHFRGQSTDCPHGRLQCTACGAYEDDLIDNIEEATDAIDTFKRIREIRGLLRPFVEQQCNTGGSR